MFWGDRIVDEVEKRFEGVIKSGTPLIVRDEKTASGRVHVGSLRSASMHAFVVEGLRERNISHEFVFEINDFDPMDGLPVYLDKAVYEPYMGKPLYTIPSPDGVAKNFAEYFGGEYVDVMREIGLSPRVYRGSELYLGGKMNDAIRLALEKRDIIRTIYKEESGSDRKDTWYPLNVICEQCGKVSTTVVTGFDGKEVTYECKERAVDWTMGCGYKGSVSPFDGHAKLPWKVEWPAKFVVNGVHFEGGGKDHYTKGGSRQVANRISREVFAYEPPYGIGHEFFLIGGAKMSSSKGAGMSAREIADLLPPHILRLVLIRSDIERQVNFDPNGDTIPTLFDHYDKIAEKKWTGAEDDDSRVFVKCHREEDSALLERRFLPRFSQIAFIIQMQHMSLEGEVEAMKGAPLTDADRAEIALRAACACTWLKEYAAPEFKFELQSTLPPCAKDITDAAREAMRTVYERLSNDSWSDPVTIHTALHEIKEASGLSPREFFAPIYCAFFGRESGPKAGWFLSTLKKDFVLTRLKEVAGI